MALPSKNAKAQNLITLWKRWSLRIRRYVPPGARAPLGLLLIAGGLFGFLPILGFWMIPLGIAVVAMDIGAVVAAWRRWREGKSSHDPNNTSE